MQDFQSDIISKCLKLCCCKVVAEYSILPIKILKQSKYSLSILGSTLRWDNGWDRAIPVSYTHLLTLLGKVNILSSLDSQFRQNIEKHNLQVSKNKHILKRLISCVKFCTVFELPLRGNSKGKRYDDSASPTNPEVYKGLINFTAELDSVMKDYLESATVFKGTSKTIQNYICLLYTSRCV